MATSSGGLNRYWTVDVLRAAAILLVAVAHFSHMKVSEDQERQISLISAVVNLGWVGVPIFFTLSGFLIGGLLVSELQASGRIRLGRFWLRRGWKIYPTFYLVVLLQMLYLWVSGAGLDSERVLREIFFLQNYGKGGLLTVSWSLAVEEHFYFLLPLLLAGMAWWLRHKNSTVIDWNVRLRGPLTWMSFFLVVICLWMRLRAAEAPNFESSNSLKFFATHLRIDALFVGVALRMWMTEGSWFWKMVQRHWKSGAVLALAMVGLGLEGGRLFDRTFGYTYYLVWLSAASSILTAVAVIIPFQKSIVSSVLSFVGRNSYAIYLIHLPVYKVMCELNALTGYRIHGLLFAVLSLVGGILAGVLLTRFVEAPCLRFRDRWAPSK